MGLAPGTRRGPDEISRSRLALLGVCLLLGTQVLVAGQSVPASDSAFAVEEATIGQIQDAILDGRVSTVGVVERYLRRIRAYNGTCVNQPDGILGRVTTIPHAGQLNALSTLNLRPAVRRAWGFDDRKARSMTDATDADPAMPDALEVAAAQDRQFRQTGRLVGPLHGVVLAVKDQYDTFDLRSTSGGDAPYANDRPPDDATFVSRLREAGAIILAKANLAEYATDGARSAFGGTFCNPYDTERVPGMSSAGSGSAVAANLVTCAIAEETVVSIRWPASVNNTVGLAPTQELVSRDGMIEPGLSTRVGPICRTVEDTAKVLDAYAGYDPKDELTVFSLGRTPPRPYASFATGTGRLDGVRIGVIREYMNRALLSQADEESLAIIERAADDLRRLGATIVDPGPEGALFQSCVARYGPELYNTSFSSRYTELFPVGPDGQPAGDHIDTLVDMRLDPSLVPEDFTFRALGRFGTPGESRYMMDRYLRERGDPNVTSNANLVNMSTFYDDANFPDRRAIRQRAGDASALDTTTRLQHRFAVQTIVLQCMQEQQLDALLAPTASVPPPKLTAPREPTANGRSPVGWSMLGQQGFPVITVPAGFTTEVWDRVRDEGGGEAPARLVGPVPARLPVGLDLVARPFDEPLLFRIAAAYEAATRHREPPADFGPVNTGR